MEGLQLIALGGNQGPRYKAVGMDEDPYETITVDRLTPIIGAEIAGVGLVRPTNRQRDEIHHALPENSVTFFRDQEMTPEQHLDSDRHFGPLLAHPEALHEPGYPDLMIIHADKDSPRANRENWHLCVSCGELPPMGSFFYVQTCPSRGGGTLFASMYAAYQALSDRMKRCLKGLTGLHDGEPIYRGLYANYGVQYKDEYPRAEHPVVRTHAVTGRKALYVNCGITGRILGVPCDESNGILNYLYAHMENPLFQCELPLARQLGRVLGQSVRAASCALGLLATHSVWFSRHRARRTSCLSQLLGARCNALL